ncbi:hypothetical protein TWF730_000095 [Orbilia blumenaviensis]|uniref:BZIP domain-containing protein n=1 Tax=Orbilia blumenaviensis TaxID=1796055 RepID=A0AAV9VMP0_9PEZI
MADKPAKARIRDNQRRSRANKKEYVASLEQKIAEYNARGIQATIEMQAAARAVALENERLRMLLGEVGVTPERVNSYLDSFSLSPEPQNQNQEVISNPSICGNGDGATKACSGPRGPRKPKSETVLQPQPESRLRACLNETSPSLCSQPSGDSNLETPCEAAASIILQMKGHEDAETLYAKFGCQGGSVGTCTIKNTDLFRIMDEE